MSSAIADVLTDLNRIPGVKGSAVITADGIMVSNALGSGFQDELVAGLVSFMVSTTSRSLREGNLGTFQRFTMHSTNGKLILRDLGEAFLVIHTDQFARLDSHLGEFEEVSRELRRLARIDV